MKKMKNTAVVCTLALATLGSGAALAQYTGPTQAPHAGHAGPGTVPLMTVRQVLDTGRDDQHARLEGRIVSHDGGKNYTFADDSGRMPVEISAKHFPQGQPINADQRVEIVGEIDKDMRSMEFEVDHVRVLPQR